MPGVATDIENQRQLLEQILVQNPSAGEPLPPLVEEPNALAQWLKNQHFLKSIGEWLNDLWKSLFAGRHGPDLTGIIRPAIYLVIITLAVWLVFAIARSISKRKSGPIKIQPGTGGPGPSAAENLALELTRALKAGDLSLAGRLRWRLFLMRTRRDPASTPAELVGGKIDTTPWYRLMFKDGAVRGTYEAFDGELSRLEGGGA